MLIITTFLGLALGKKRSNLYPPTTNNVVCKNLFTQKVLVLLLCFVSLGMVSTSMQPIFAHLVDIRHAAVYGNVYAISDMAVCLAMSVGKKLQQQLNFTTTCHLRPEFHN